MGIEECDLMARVFGMRVSLRAPDPVTTPDLEGVCCTGPYLVGALAGSFDVTANIGSAVPLCCLDVIGSEIAAWSSESCSDARTLPASCQPNGPSGDVVCGRSCEPMRGSPNVPRIRRRSCRCVLRGKPGLVTPLPQSEASAHPTSRAGQ